MKTLTELSARAFKQGLIMLALGGSLFTGTAAAQTIEDKLRTQLRATTEELHQLQDTQVQLQADKVAAEQQRDKALADLKQAQTELAAAKGQSPAAEQALAEEKARHAQDSQQLASYQSRYEDLQTQFRAQEAQVHEANAERDTQTAQLHACSDKNTQLYQVGQEILRAYEHIGLGTFLGSRQPFAQAERVKYDNIAQQYGDQLRAGQFDQRIKPAAMNAATSK